MSKKRKVMVYLKSIILGAILLVSIGLNIYLIDYINSIDSNRSYLEYPEEVYIMEAGILKNNFMFENGIDVTLSYDLDNVDYSKLIQQYDLKSIAGQGTELEMALRLMQEFAPRLFHHSNYDNKIEIRALPLLEYSLDNQENGINCRNKAQILNEMCLALSIYARKVWIMPNSPYDTDCHVVNEIWDTTLNKWVMLDITSNQYWVDESGTPLSIIEIRAKGAQQEFCTPVFPNDDLSDIYNLKETYMPSFLYIMKNMVYTRYCADYGVGESDVKYLLYPKNLDKSLEIGLLEASEKSISDSPYDE